MDLESFVLLGIYHGTHEVGGKEVRSELDTAEPCIDGLGERADRQGLGKAGDSFEEDVPVCQQSDEEVLHKVLLPYDHLPHLKGKKVHE